MSTLNPSDLILAKVKSHVPGWNVPIDAHCETDGAYVGIMVTVGDRQKFYVCDQTEESCAYIGKAIVIDYIDYGDGSMGEAIGILPSNGVTRTVRAETTPASLARAFLAAMGATGGDLPPATVMHEQSNH